MKKLKNKPLTLSHHYRIITFSNHLVISLFIAFIFSFTGLNAAYLENIPMKLIQPNGDTLYCYASGDEFFNYLHDKDGYTIIQNSDGYYMYAIYAGDQIAPSQFVAGTVNPSDVGLRSNVVISSAEYQARRTAWFNYQDILRLRTSDRNHGNLNNLVVFIRFADDDEITKLFSTVEKMFNNQEEGASSMYNYFKTTSYGQLTIPSFFYPEPNEDTILSYQDIYPRSYYQPYHEESNPEGYKEDRTEREHQLLKRAIEYIADSVPEDIDLDYNHDGYVDNVCFVVKGGVGAWANLLWPHRWALYSDTVEIHGKRVWDYNFMLEGASTYFNNAVLCHEMQHTLSFPDLYHYSSSGPSPVGQWDIMESNPNPPQQSGAYMKWKYGNWVNEPTIFQQGDYTLNSIGSGIEPLSYKIPTSDPNQFFVLEYRNATDPFDRCYSSGTGLLIYRINTRWNGNAGYNPGEGVFDEVYIFRPGGNSPAQNGIIYRAHFGAGDRTEFHANADVKPFLTDGTIVYDLAITNITIIDNQVTFNYSKEIPESVNEFEKNSTSFYMHPNPANNYLEIILSSDATFTMQTLAAQIFDAKGLLIKSVQLNNEKTQIDISNLAKGFYIVKIGYETKKLIVK